MSVRGGLVLCPFCFEEKPASREHIFSKTICGALGVDRASLSVSLNANDETLGHPLALDDRAVKLPCESCNSGWMSRLETDTAQVLSGWLEDPATPLTPIGVYTITRWLTKTAFVLTFADADARRFMSTPQETALPDFTTAKLVARGSGLGHVRAGVAVSNNMPLFWAVGNSTVEPPGPGRISCRAVNAAAFNLGPISCGWPCHLWRLTALISREACLPWCQHSDSPTSVPGSPVSSWRRFGPTTRIALPLTYFEPSRVPRTACRASRYPSQVGFEEASHDFDIPVQPNLVKSSG